MTTRRSPLGTWIKVYVSALDTKAHYSDAQFRALVEIWMHAARQPVRGVFTHRSAIDRKVGSDNVDFLIEQGDIELLPNSSVAVHKWADYQSGVLSTERGSRSEKPGGERVDNSSATAPEQFANSSLTRARDALSPLPSKNVDVENGVEPVAGASYPVEGSDEDALDRYYALTGSRPWGKRVGEWIGELQAKHGLTHVVAALEVEAAGGREKLIERVAVRLERQADRVAKAEARKPKPVDPLIAEQRAAYADRYGPETADLPVGDPAAGRAAFEALRGSFGARGGLPVGVGSVLPSRKNGQGQPLMDAGMSGSTAPARGPERGTPSPRSSAVRPSSSGPFKKASTDEAAAKEKS
jgi:hypothetical protein